MNKPDHKQLIIEAFRANHWEMTLGYILSHHWGYEARARFTELRHKGYTITYERGATASENTYRMIPPDESGQMRWVA